MGLADEFERRLEGVVEGFFSKAFRSKIEPAEIGRRLLREMEGGKSVSMSAVYVPNRYVVRLSVPDHQRLEGLLPTLRDEFAALLSGVASERRWRPAGPVDVGFEASDTVDEGRVEVAAEHDSQSEEPEVPTVAVLLIHDSEPPRRVELGAQRLVIGRQEDCDLVIADPQVSRKHAEIAQRPDGWWLSDLDASNGTFLNDTLVKERRLHPGDVIRLGSTEITFAEER